MTYDFLIFGATGMQGKIVTRDLADNSFKIFISSLHQKGINHTLKKLPLAGGKAIDISNETQISKLVSVVKPKVIINCAEGDWNTNVYRAALRGAAHVIDLGSDIPTTKEQMALHHEFKHKNLTAITGCGSTPGVNNIMLKYALSLFDEVKTIHAGFAWNSNIKKFVVPFSMESIIEEFTDPAPLVEDSKWIEAKPLDTVEKKTFRVVGEAVNFIVRHPETYTFYLYYNKLGVKNVRFFAGFPKHSFKTIISYIKNGLRNDRTICLGDGDCVTLGELTKILEKKYPHPRGYLEKENLWVSVEGVKNGKRKNILMECIVPTLPGWEDAGCNVDTGLPASIIGQMLLKGVITKRGSFAPDPVVPHQEFFIELQKRGMRILENGKAIKKR